MKRIYYLTLAALLAGSSAVGQATTKKFRQFASPSAFTAKVEKQGAFKRSAVRQSPAGAALAATDPDAAIKNAEGWGVLTGTDGKTWFYTQKFTIDSSRRTYTGSEFTVTNADNKQLATIKVDIAADENVNVIEPFGTVTTKFFDRNQNTWEVLVYIHKYDADYNQYGEFRVYNQNGEIVQTYEADNAQFVDFSEGYNTYQRIVFVKGVNDGGVAKTQLDVMQPCGWNDAPTVEKQLSVETELLSNSAGSYFNAFNIDGDPYYVLSHYEKPYFEDNTADDPVATPDNHYLLEVYDKKFDLVKTVTVPVAAEAGSLYGMRCFSLFSDDGTDMSRGKFTHDDKLNFIVTNMNYSPSNDDFTYTFDVYDEDSQKVATINQGVSVWQKLSDIPGKETQYGFIINGSTASSIEFVEIPSCNLVTTFQAMVGDAQLSDNYDRYPVGDDYQYVFGIGNGLYDEQKNVISRIGWFNHDGSVDHYVRINIGQDGENFTPLVNGTVLNPYLFNTDDLHEYLFLAKIKNESTGIIANELWLANDNGEVLRKFKGDDEKGDISVCDVLDNRLIVSYANQSTGYYSIDFYNLPFSKFEKGGDGTAESPYQISTVGDLQQIEQNPSAYYELANDIDMTNVEWTPISMFTGHFDGKNHKLLNLEIPDNLSVRHVGLFGQIVGNGEADRAEVKNLVLVNPELSLPSGVNNAGVLAGSATATAIENVHAYSASIYGYDTEAKVGGLVGDASLFTTIESSDINKLSLIAENADFVGGLVGNLETSSTINASSVSDGAVRGAVGVGGIAGATDSSESNITNAYYDGSIGGLNTVGGIVGKAGRSLIENCHVDVTTMSVSEPDQWTHLVSFGGIAGSLETDWTGSTDVLVRGNVVGSGCIMLFLDQAKPTDGGAHRIVGSTVADNSEASGKTEVGLADNYAAIALISTDDEEGATTVDGATITDADITDAFLAGLGFKFGTSADQPWVAVEGDLPILYYQTSVCVLMLNKSDVMMDVDDTMTLELEAFGVDDLTGVTFISSDPEVVSVGEVDVDEEYAEVKLTALKSGKATITVAFGGQTVTCKVIVRGDAAVADVEADNLSIHYADGVVAADGATAIEVYATTGALVGKASADRLAVDAQGLLIVVATDAAGHRTVSKIIAK